MKRTNKKGFTIVELVIVIAVIAILAVVLIPTFVRLVRKTKINTDTQLIRNLNTALEADKVDNTHSTMSDALDAAAKYGYDVSKINASATNNEILWDSENDVFCYYNDGEIEYLPDSVDNEKKLPAESNKLWKIYNGEVPALASQTYSIYLGTAAAASSFINNGSTVKVGFDMGNQSIDAITYEHSGSAQDVVIRTNGGTLTVNAPLDTVKHYGEANVLFIDAVATASYHEFGKIGNAQIKTGRIVIENEEATIDNLLLVAKSDKSGFEDIIVETKTGAELPTFDRTDVNISSTGTLVLNVVTPSTDEYVYLTKAGVVEQIVITTTETADVSGQAGNVASKSTKTQAVAEQVANVGTKDASGNYVDSNNEIVIYADGTVADGKDASSIATEAKADDTAVQTGLTKFAGGAGTKQSPYLISNPNQFLNIESGSNASSQKYYLLVNDIDFDDETYSDLVFMNDKSSAFCLISGNEDTQTKNIILNGGGHNLSLSITGCGISGANRLSLFGYLGETSVLENFNVIIDNYDTNNNCFFTLVSFSGWSANDYLTFKDIIVKSSVENAVISGDLKNNGVFTSQAYYGRVDFVNCDNYINLNGTNNKYYAPYVGGYIQNNTIIVFTDCDNYGNLSGVGSAAMFIGNNTNINKNSVTITNSYNYGTIRAASASGLFAQNNDSANAREIEELYLASCNRGIISVQSFNGFTYSIEENEINYNLTNTNNVGKIVLRINGHTNVLDNNNEYIGARGFQITQEISPVNSTNGTFTYKLGQVIRQLDYNLDIELSNSNKIYDDGEYVKVYYVEKDNQAYYVFDDGYGNYSVSPNLSIAITAYSTSGSILGNAVLEND